MTLTCPWGTQKMADDLVARLKGFQYQPYTASGAQVDPAAELGDGITVHGLYSGIYSRRTRFGRLHNSEVSAPTEEEIDHEFPYVPKQERKVTRKMGQMSAQLLVHAQQILAEVAAREESDREFRASFDIQAKKIAAKVEKSGGEHGSFGWELLDSSWAVYANGQKVFIVTKNGAEVVGKITAKSGKIGGFDILADRLSYNGQTWGGTNTTGIYIGPSGIQLGKNFRVDSAGNLYAYSGTFDGYVKAKRIEYGGDDGYLSGSGIEEHSLSGRRLEYGTVSTSYTSGGINTSLGYANFSNDVFDGNESVSYIKTGSLKLDGHYLNRASVTIAGVSLKYVSWI